MKMLAVAGVAFGLAAGSLLAQSPAFEVAAIRPAPPMGTIAAQVMSGKVHLGIRIDGNKVDIGSLTLRDLIQAAYKVKPYQLTGPSWMGEQRFDILANMPEGTSREQVPEMLQALLADRFQLTIHRDTKDQQIYALVVGKGGSKLIPAAASDGDVAGPAATGPGAAKNGFALDTPDGRLSVSTDNKGGAVVNSAQTGKMRMSMGPDRTMMMEADRVTMTRLVEELSSFLDRPVLDSTELKGSYAVTLQLSMDDLMRAAQSRGIQMPMPGAGFGAGPRSAGATATASDPSGSSIFESIQKLGLKLEPRKMPVDMIVVDHLEKNPTDN